MHHPDLDDGDTRSPALRRLPLADEAGKGSDSEAPSPDGCTHDSKGHHTDVLNIASWQRGKLENKKGKTQRKGKNHRKSQKKKKNASQMVRFTSHHSMSQVTPMLFNYILQI